MSVSQFRIYRDVCRHLYKMDGAELKVLALSAGVSPKTLYNWRSGAVFAPRINTLTKVSSVLGYEIVLRKVNRAEVVDLTRRRA